MSNPDVNVVQRVGLALLKGLLLVANTSQHKHLFHIYSSQIYTIESAVYESGVQMAIRQRKHGIERSLNVTTDENGVS